MVERLPLTLRAYQLMSAAATPLVPKLLARRLTRGKEHPARLPERRGEEQHGCLGAAMDLRLPHEFLADALFLM